MVGVVSALFLTAASIGFAVSGIRGVIAAGLAAIVCLSSSLLGLLVVEVASQRGHFLAGALGSMLPRMGLPLVFCLAMHLTGGPFVEAGVIYYILAFYAATLAIDTWLSIGHASPSETPLQK